MKLHLSPQAGIPGAPETVAHVTGDALTVDGTVYDLSAVAEGSGTDLEGEHPFVGSITRKGGEIVATIRWAYDPAAAADHQPVDPALWTVTTTDGAVQSPIVPRAGA